MTTLFVVLFCAGVVAAGMICGPLIILGPRFIKTLRGLLERLGEKS